MKIKKVRLLLIIGFAMICGGVAFAEVVPQELVLKTLNSNGKPDDIVAEMFVDGMYISNDDLVKFPFVGKSKFTIKNTLEKELLNERLNYIKGSKVKITFALVDKKSKIYLLKSIEGLETVDEYKIRKEKELNSDLGLGYLTNQEVQIQRKKNKSLGKGEFTDWEIDFKILSQAKIYEEMGRYCFALGKYYDYLCSDTPPEKKLKAFESFEKLKLTILSGMPGFGNFDDSQLHDQWVKLLYDADKYCETHYFFDVVPKPLKIGDFDDLTQTANCYLSANSLRTNRYENTADIIYKGFKKARKSNWNDIEFDLKEVPAEYNYDKIFNVIDNNGNQILPPGATDIFNPIIYNKVSRSIVDKIKEGSANVNFISVQHNGKIIPQSSYCVGQEEINRKSENFQNVISYYKSKSNKNKE